MMDSRETFETWNSLKAEPRQVVVERLKSRMRLIRFGKDMLATNAWAFWIVINALLKLLFSRAPNRG